MINYSIAEQFNLSLTEIFWETQRQFCVNTRNDLCSRGKYILLKVLPTLMALFWFIVQSVMLGQIVQARGGGTICGTLGIWFTNLQPLYRSTAWPNSQMSSASARTVTTLCSASVDCMRWSAMWPKWVCVCRSYDSPSIQLRWVIYGVYGICIK